MPVTFIGRASFETPPLAAPQDDGFSLGSSITYRPPGERPGECRGISKDARRVCKLPATGKSHDRGEVDDRAAAAADHAARGDARAEKNAGQVDCDNLVPIVERMIHRRMAEPDPGAVHQNVDPAAMLHDGGEGLFQRR